ncbi:MAG: translation initiation factor IF-2 [Bacilli bacterium]|nr:translation initiation factor IF-2 [Bacilli bacterium]
MMSVLEYANDVNLKVDVILDLCKKLDIDVNNEDDMLDDEAIILLDNEIENGDFLIDESNDEEEEEDLIEISNKNKDDNTRVSMKKKSSKNAKTDFMKKRKEMYKHKDKLQTNEVIISENDVIYRDNMSVGELAKSIGVGSGEVIGKLMGLGLMMTVNNSVDYDTAEVIVMDYGKNIKREEATDESNFEELEIVDDPKDLVERPPVVTIMGHVDHGKTTLLDTIRKTNVVEGEAGGITQAIGAYQVVHNGKKITFIDTPGHAAFTEMRARGASVTDIVIIIVAADDGVMPQTKEAIDHAKAAKVPIIVAVNKIDKAGADPNKVMTEMAEAGVMPEEWGGDVMFVNISAKAGTGISDLLERILLISEMLELKANPKRYASGTVLESEFNKKTGVKTSLLIGNGTLRLGDAIVVGDYAGKVRTLKNDQNESLVEAKPGDPVSITGLNESPSAGDKFMVFENEKKAKAIANERKLKTKNANMNVSQTVSLDELFNKIEAGEKEVNILLKADVRGSEEAVKNSLLKLDVEGIKVNIIRSGIGAVSESDIVLAAASGAIIIGFNIRPDNKTMEYAKTRGVEIRLYDIIYKLVEDIEQAMKGKLDPIYEEKVLGEAEVRKLFKFSKVGTIAGSMVTNGLIKRDAKARVIRDGAVIYDGNINSLAREKDQVKEVKSGFECGITIENFNDIKENDIIEAYEIVEIER